MKKKVAKKKAKNPNNTKKKVKRTKVLVKPLPVSQRRRITEDIIESTRRAERDNLKDDLND